MDSFILYINNKSIKYANNHSITEFDKDYLFLIHLIY